MPLITVESRRVESRWRYLPTWYSYSPVFTALGSRVGYTRAQAEFRMRLAIVVHVVAGERGWKIPRRKVQP